MENNSNTTKDTLDVMRIENGFSKFTINGITQSIVEHLFDKRTTDTLHLVEYDQKNKLFKRAHYTSITSEEAAKNIVYGNAIFCPFYTLGRTPTGELTGIYAIILGTTDVSIGNKLYITTLYNSLSQHKKQQ